MRDGTTYRADPRFTRITPAQVREATRIVRLFFTGKETPPESPQERKPESSQERSPSPGPLFTAPETIRDK